MASPQKEHGFTPIANELLDALARTRIPGEARQLLDVIIRHTYGWQRKTVQISYTRFSELTNIRLGHIHRGLKLLLTHQVIEQGIDGYRLQKNYDLWKPYTRASVFPDTKKGVPEKGVKPTPFTVLEPTPKRGSARSLITCRVNELQAPKERFKEIKEISLSNTSLSLPEREVVLKDLKHFFPTLNVPDVVPTERAYLFLAKLRFREISKDEIRSAPAFLIAMRDEDITPYLEREAVNRARNRALQERESVRV
jgi:phage replication O-like protein O